MKYRKSLLITSFEAFYLMLLQARKQIENGVFFNVNDDSNERDAKIAAFQNRLCVFIKEKDSSIAYENGKLAADTFSEVIYIMISLADEMFLSFDWDGKAYWRTHLLEQKFFATNESGEKLLTNLDKFLQERHVQDSEIGLIYLYVLALGFKGKLRYEPDLEFYLSQLKEQIFYTIYKQAPKLFKKQEVLFDQAIENVFVERAQNRNNSLRFMTKVFGICCSVYLFASHVLWHVETRATWQIMKNVNRKPLFATILDSMQVRDWKNQRHRDEINEQKRKKRETDKKQTMQGSQVGGEE